MSPRPPLKPLLRRLVVAVTAAAMGAVVSSVAIRFADTYLVNHGHAGLRKEIVAAGYLSAGDVLLLVCTLLAAGAGWFLSSRKR